MTDCIGLAAQLSENYRDTTPFDNSRVQLSRYLSTHGLLLTMCFPTECILPFGSTHVSGSWINQEIGPQVIYGPSIGLALDPLKVDIQCLYPTDGGTQERDDKGCGPFPMDPEHGSRGANSINYFTKQILRKQAIEYKNLNFGIDTPWEDVYCDYFFPKNDPAQMWNMDSEGALKFETVLSMAQKQHQAIMGHPVCTCRKNNATTFPAFFVNEGNGWDANDWQEMVKMQLSFMNRSQDQPSALFYWNEIVMSLPRTQMKDIVSAIFYLDSSDMEEKARQANFAKANDVSKNVLDGKPVMSLRLDAGFDEDLLTCPGTWRSHISDNVSPSVLAFSHNGTITPEVIVNARNLMQRWLRP